MEPNRSSSSGHARVQLPSIKNLVDTLPPPNAYRTPQVAPGFTPLSQHRTTDDVGGFRTRPLHASPAPPSRSVPAAAVTSTASYGRTRGEQELPYQTSTNDVIQARTSRMSMSGTTAPIPMRVNQDPFNFRSSSPPSAAMLPSMEHRRYAEDSPAVSASQRTHGQRQSQGSYGLSSNPQSRGFGDRPTSALISPPDRDGVSHRSVQDLQSRAGRLYLKANSERVLPLRNEQEFDEYDGPTPTTPLGRHPHGAMADWDQSNTQPSRYREGYDASTVDHTWYRPDSVDRSQHLQRRQEPINYQERRVDPYPSRSHYNLEPGRWERENIPVHRNDIRNRGNPSNPYAPSVPIDTSSRLGREVGTGQNPSRPILENEGWGSSHSSDRSSGRRLDHSEQENYIPRSAEQLHRQPRKENGGDEWPYFYNGVATSVMPSGHRPAPIKAMVRHRSKEDFPRVLSELTNEARDATAGGTAMKKIHEFSNTVANFGLYAQQQPSRPTIEDMQEMSLRIELIFRMARELQKGKKQMVAKIREQSATAQPVPTLRALAPKKTPMTKEEKRMLEDMEKIRKKRTSAQQGIKDKYRKRNKKTQPPKKCSSCGIKETPEWRKGPEGPRSLCNACGLHYAKLMRNRSSANEGKWIGSGSAPPIDIVTLRQVTGVGIQPQANERGEYEIPGIYTHIPPSRMLQGPFIPNRRIPPSSSSTIQPASQGQASSSTVANDAQTSSVVNVAVNEAPEQPSDNGTESVIDKGGRMPPSSVAESQGTKRKAPSDDEGTDDDGVAPPSKRQRVSSPQVEDVRMESLPVPIIIDNPPESTSSINDSSGERSF